MFENTLRLVTFLIVFCEFLGGATAAPKIPTYGHFLRITPEYNIKGLRNCTEFFKDSESHLDLPYYQYSTGNQKAVYKFSKYPIFMLLEANTTNGRIDGHVKSAYKSIPFSAKIAGEWISANQILLNFYNDSDSQLFERLMTPKPQEFSTKTPEFSAIYTYSTETKFWKADQNSPLQDSRLNLFKLAPMVRSNVDYISGAVVCKGIDSASDVSIFIRSGWSTISDLKSFGGKNTTRVSRLFPSFKYSWRNVLTKSNGETKQQKYSMEMAGLPSGVLYLDNQYVAEPWRPDIQTRTNNPTSNRHCIVEPSKLKEAISKAEDWDVISFDRTDSKSFAFELQSHSSRWFFYDEDIWWSADFELEFRDGQGERCGSVRYQIYDSVICGRPAHHNPVERNEDRCFEEKKETKADQHRLQDRIRKILAGLYSSVEQKQ